MLEVFVKEGLVDIDLVVNEALKGVVLQIEAPLLAMSLLGHVDEADQFVRLGVGHDWIVIGPLGY